MSASEQFKMRDVEFRVQTECCICERRALRVRGGFDNMESVSDIPYLTESRCRASYVKHMQDTQHSMDTCIHSHTHTAVLHHYHTTYDDKHLGIICIEAYATFLSKQILLCKHLSVLFPS